ncbi:phytanoyl-CoA dioxygenase family protein [Frankia tisae]|uniref:phytanoyl-CoA dioxygenase family protein n=1 Tax=Frankia tisae TaxID=2950104 RepID=UPI0021C0F56C|nr:phytanoyl-CoA dioxygenase family protein [Frankia tisae]
MTVEAPGVVAGSVARMGSLERDGWLVGRQVLPVELVRRVRQPLVEALRAEGLVGPSPVGADRVRWTGGIEDARRHRNGSGVTNWYRDELAFLPLVQDGHVRRVVEDLWGRRALLWANTAAFLKVPDVSSPERMEWIGHADGWQNDGIGAPSDHFDLWVPLTDIGSFDGSLAFHTGSHVARAERYPRTSHGVGPAQVADEGWEVAGYSVGDAVLFRPDVVHSSAVNTGLDLRIGVVFRGQVADLPLPPAAGMSWDRTQTMSTTESCVLALLATRPDVGWTRRELNRAFTPPGMIGRYLPLPPPGQLSRSDVLGQAVDMLATRGAITRADRDDQADDGGEHSYSLTETGRQAADEWLAAPTRLVAELMTVVPLRLALARAARSDLAGMVRSQMECLDQLAESAEKGLSDDDEIRQGWRRATVHGCREILTAADSATINR